MGIDLSSEMINICRATYPHATFHHGDFLDYMGPPKGLSEGPPKGLSEGVSTGVSEGVSPSKITETETQKTETNHNDTLESPHLFDAIVFNECLHNFRDIESTLVHALSLVRLNGCVIVSHPRGFDNVFMQAGKNKWLCPSLLPSNKGKQSLITYPYPHYRYLLLRLTFSLPLTHRINLLSTSPNFNVFSHNPPITYRI